MGQTTEKVIIKNYADMFNAKEGLISKDAIREVEVDAIVDTGATYLCLPPKVIAELGLMFSYSTPVTTANGEVPRRIFLGAYITIKDRNTEMEVMESDERTPPLIGYLILEALDFVVDTQSRQLIGNPKHDGRRIVDLYRDMDAPANAKEPSGKEE